MSLSQAIDINTNYPAALCELSQKLIALNERSRTQEAFDTLEHELHQAFAETERACMGPLLEEYDINVAIFECEDKTYRRSLVALNAI